jgi:hypothetical protein
MLARQTVMRQARMVKFGSRSEFFNPSGEFFDSTDSSAAVFVLFFPQAAGLVKGSRTPDRTRRPERNLRLSAFFS